MGMSHPRTRFFKTSFFLLSVFSNLSSLAQSPPKTVHGLVSDFSQVFFPSAEPLPQKTFLPYVSKNSEALTPGTEIALMVPHMSGKSQKFGEVVFVLQYFKDLTDSKNPNQKAYFVAGRVPLKTKNGPPKINPLTKSLVQLPQFGPWIEGLIFVKGLDSQNPQDLFIPTPNSPTSSVNTDAGGAEGGNNSSALRSSFTSQSLLASSTAACDFTEKKCPRPQLDPYDFSSCNERWNYYLCLLAHYDEQDRCTKKVSEQTEARFRDTCNFDPWTDEQDAECKNKHFRDCFYNSEDGLWALYQKAIAAFRFSGRTTYGRYYEALGTMMTSDPEAFAQIVLGSDYAELKSRCEQNADEKCEAERKVNEDAMAEIIASINAEFDVLSRGCCKTPACQEPAKQCPRSEKGVVEKNSRSPKLNSNRNKQN